MDNPTTLLTAIMFVTVLAMAIGNLLIALSDIIAGLREPMPCGIHLAWMVVLLLAALGLFWETTTILQVQQWRFPDFLYTILGPMVLLFAASVILAPSRQAAAGREAYFELSGRFFLMLALSQAWIVGLDVMYDNLGPMSVLNAVLAGLFILLLLVRVYALHVAGIVVTVLCLFASFAWEFSVG
jgi:hypothetical protein